MKTKFDVQKLALQAAESLNKLNNLIEDETQAMKDEGTIFDEPDDRPQDKTFIALLAQVNEEVKAHRELIERYEKALKQ